jgi:hypothetical protein
VRVPWSLRASFGLSPPRWRQWLKDVLNERVAKPSNRLVETLYLGLGVRGCTDPNFPPHGPIASQFLLAGRSEQDCPRETDWRELVEYFYPTGTQVKSGSRPFLPTTGVVHYPDHRLRITFNSVFRAGNAYKNVAWRYRVFQRQGGAWVPFRDVKPIGIRGPVPNHLDLSVAQAAGTHRYIVRACNPVGCSQAAKVRDPNTGLDITG